MLLHCLAKKNIDTVTFDNMIDEVFFFFFTIILCCFCLNQVPANTDSVMCFGPLVPDGYAICYNPQADHVHFSITAFNCCEETNAEKLAHTLKDTLCHLQELLQPTV